jgi:hypothetical protein
MVEEPVLRRIVIERSAIPSTAKESKPASARGATAARRDAPKPLPQRRDTIPGAGYWVQIVAEQIPERTAPPPVDAELKHTLLERPRDTDDRSEGFPRWSFVPRLSSTQS